MQICSCGHLESRSHVHFCPQCGRSLSNRNTYVPHRSSPGLKDYALALLGIEEAPDDISGLEGFVLTTFFLLLSPLTLIVRLLLKFVLELVFPLLVVTLLLLYVVLLVLLWCLPVVVWVCMFYLLATGLDRYFATVLGGTNPLVQIVIYLGSGLVFVRFLWKPTVEITEIWVKFLERGKLLKDDKVGVIAPLLRSNDLHMRNQFSEKRIRHPY